MLIEKLFSFFGHLIVWFFLLMLYLCCMVGLVLSVSMVIYGIYLLFFYSGIVGLIVTMTGLVNGSCIFYLKKNLYSPIEYFDKHLRDDLNQPSFAKYNGGGMWN